MGRLTLRWRLVSAARRARVRWATRAGLVSWRAWVRLGCGHGRGHVARAGGGRRRRRAVERQWAVALRAWRGDVSFPSVFWWLTYSFLDVLALAFACCSFPNRPLLPSQNTLLPQRRRLCALAARPAGRRLERRRPRLRLRGVAYLWRDVVSSSSINSSNNNHRRLHPPHAPLDAALALCRRAAHGCRSRRRPVAERPCAQPMWVLGVAARTWSAAAVVGRRWARYERGCMGVRRSSNGLAAGSGARACRWSGGWWWRGVGGFSATAPADRSRVRLGPCLGAQRRDGGRGAWIGRRGAVSAAALGQWGRRGRRQQALPQPRAAGADAAAPGRGVGSWRSRWCAAVGMARRV